MPSPKKKTSTTEAKITTVATTPEKVSVEGVRVTYVVNGNIHHNKAFYEQGQVVTHNDEYFDVLQKLGFLTQK